MRVGLDSYVRRKADDQLLRNLSAGEFTLLLSSRKVGKSSMIANVFAELSGHTLLAQVELTSATGGVTEEGWYFSLAQRIEVSSAKWSDFRMETGWRAWWEQQKRNEVPLGDRLLEFFRIYLLEASEKPWVIAIDEIDTTIPLSFSDDFFAAIRSCQNLRAQEGSSFRRLTFLLAGVATPAQLIKDNRRTPFNVGTEVRITDFTAQDAKVLLRGLGLEEFPDHQVLLTVLEATGGHPYLTQRVFAALALKIGKESNESQFNWRESIHSVIAETFLQPGKRKTEAHFDDIAHRRIGEIKDLPLKRRILHTWMAALKDKPIKDDPLAPHLVELKLCGLLVPDPQNAECLIARNLIYRKVFNADWALGELPEFDLPVGSPANEHPLYVRRQIDDDLAKCILSGDSVWLAAPRRTGKTSLIRHTLGEAADHGVHSVYCDISSITPRLRDDDWFFALAALIAEAAPKNKGFTLDPEWANWWEQQKVPAPNRLQAFLRHFILEKSDARWVFAFDEIELAAAQSSLENFFRILRFCQQDGAVAGSPFQRVSFVLISEGKVDETAYDELRPGLNAMKSLVVRDFIRDFTLHEAAGLLPALGLPNRDDHAALLAVMRWTGGHPFMTISVFRELSQQRSKFAEFDTSDWQRVVDGIVNTLYLGNGAKGSDFNLSHIAQSLLGGLTKPSLKRRILVTWQKSLRGSPVRDDSKAMHIMKLKECGLLMPDLQNPEFLIPRNRIYREVFNESWAAGAMPSNKPFMIATAAGIAAALAITGIFYQQSQSQNARIAELRLSIESSQDDIPTRFYEELRAIKGQEETADQLLAEFWKKKARAASVERPRDAAAQLWLKALGTHEDSEARLQARRAWSGSLPQVALTFRHGASVNHASFSPDGRRVVTASGHNAARVWDLVSGKPLGEPLQHDSQITDVSFSPDGRLVVTASMDKTAQVWNAESGSPVGHRLLHEDSIWAASFSPDGQWVVTASEDRTARVWETGSGMPSSNPLQHKDKVTSASFSPDGRRVVTASDGNTAQLWDVETSRPVGKTMQHQDRVNRAMFSQDGRLVVTTSDDRTARVWSAESGEPVGRPYQHDSLVLGLSISKDGKRFVTACGDKAHIWDTDTGALTGKLLRHQSWVSSVSLSPDGQRVVTASHDNSARVWEVESGQPVGKPLQHEARVYRASFSPDGLRVVTASEDKTARVWNIESGPPQGIRLENGFIVWQGIFSQDGRYVAFIGDDGTRLAGSLNIVQVWDANKMAPTGKPVMHGGEINFAVFSHSGNSLATAGEDGTVQVWDAQSGKLLFQLRHRDSVTYTFFSPDDRWILTVSDDKTAQVWNAENGQPVGESLNHEEKVTHASFSPDGRRVVTASDDKTARVWDAESGQPVGKPLQHESFVNHARFSPNGRRVVTASDDKTARVWDAESCQPVGKPLQHEHSVSHASFSPDGRRVVTASDDKTARVWDAESCQPVGKPLQHEFFVNHARFSPDGQRIITQTQQRLSWWKLSPSGDYTALVTVWANGGSWASEPFLATPDAQKILILDSWTGDTTLLRELAIDQAETGLPDLPAPATTLLRNSMLRFGLRFAFNSEGEMKPALEALYPATKLALDEILTAKPGSGPGRVISPYEPKAELDVTGLESGTLSFDPASQKVFRVP
jgi:WD40 repeat protein